VKSPSGAGGTRRCKVLLALALCLSPWLGEATHAASLTIEALRAWEGYVAATEARIARELAEDRGRFFAQDFADRVPRERTRALAGELPLAEMRTMDGSGRPLPVTDATIVHWRGTILIPGVTLDRLLERAQHPSERGPFPPDVLALRILAREPDALTLFIRMTRQKVVTVTYNSEHAVRYHRHDAVRASSRSVATRIAEVERTAAGERERPQTDDHGFLWRLNSYWRYEQVADGVLVEMESLSLSRKMPMGLGTLAWPIVRSIARESIERTLLAFRAEQLR
jgi:hypothetical protein